jgi:transposase
METNQTNVSEVRTERASGEPEVTVIKLGLDVHAEQITVCRQLDGQLPQPAQRRTWDQVLAQVRAHRARGQAVYTCYEAGPCGYGLHRQLTALGAVNVVVAPQCWDERGRRVKTDPRDARELCQRLDRYVRGNTAVFSVVRVPTPAQERVRALCRQRGLVLRERQRCELRGHGLMLAQGVRAPSQWWQDTAWRELAPQLPAWLAPHVERWRRHALRLEAELAELTPRIELLSTGQRAPKGLGALTAALLQAEVLDWARFTNRRQPASYTGLCPSEHSSGRRRRQGSVTKHGNPRVRHLLVEAIWRMLAWQPDYPPLQKVRAAAGARARKRAVVAAARRLAVDLWRLATGRGTPEQLHLHMTKL